MVIAPPYGGSVASMDNLVGFFLAILGALVALLVLYFVIYGAALAALRQYRREEPPKPRTPPIAE